MYDIEIGIKTKDQNENSSRSELLRPEKFII